MARKKQLTNLNNDSVVLEPNKYPSLSANLQAKGLNPEKMGIKVDAKSLDTRNAIIQTLVNSQEYFYDLLKKNDPTQIPFLTTSQGNILINPSTVSLSTLQKIAQNEIVARCLDMNATSIYNSLGDVYHENKQQQDFLRDSYKNCNGGLRRIIENILTSDVFGFSVNYIRDYVDDYGNTRLEQLDLLPPSTILFTATSRGDIENIFMYIYTYPYANTQNLFSFPFNYGGNNFAPFDTQGIDPLASYSNVEYVLRSNILNTFGLVVLDKEKTLHMVSDNIIKIANPYGWNPLTRRVYDLVMLYDLYKQLQTTFLSYRACPLLVGYADSHQMVDDPTGNGAAMNALDGLYSSFKDMGFNGALILSGLKDQIYHIEAIPSEGDTKAFSEAIDWYAKQIEQCLGLFSNEESSYASATTQTSFYGRLIQYKKEKIADLIVNKLNKYLITKNFDKNATNFGYFENVVQNLDDQLKTQKLFSEATATNGFNPGLIKKDNDYMRTQQKQPLLTDEEFEEIKQFTLLNGTKSVNDNSSRVNTKDSKPHYKHAGNADV